MSTVILERVEIKEADFHLFEELLGNDKRSVKLADTWSWLCG